MEDRELLYQLLAKQDWDEIAKILYRNAQNPGTRIDPIVQQAVTYFEAEFFAFTASLPAEMRVKKFEYTSLIIELRRHGFSANFVAQFIDERLKLMKEVNSSALLSYAMSHQERPLAKDIIREMQAAKPEVVAASRRENMSIRATDVAQGKAQTIRLFKSKQEQNFYEAVRRVFPTYHPYPNVALSCVLDYAAIKDRLTEAQRGYFFRAIIDSVVFDAMSGYEPKYFIELDSSFHDSPQAAANDSLKDAIFKAANTKLIRIRPLNAKASSVEEFERLVSEVMRHG